MEKLKNIPVLRFPEFSGEWEKKKLEEVADIVMGQSPDGDSYNTNGIGTPLINGPVEFTEKYPVKVKWTTKPSKYCQDKDILFCVRGSTTGRMNIANDNYCIGRGVAAIRANKKSTSEFIELLLIKNIDGILNLTAGSTFVNLDSKSLKKFPFKFPILSEQKEIAIFLTTVDNKLQKLKKKKNLLEQYKKGLMQKIFSQELQFKDDNGAAFPKWEKKKLGEISQFLDGKRKPIKESDRTKMKGDIPYYGASGIIDYVNDYIFDEEIILLGEDGENIISRNLPLAFRVSGKCWINNHAHVIKPSNNVNIDFLTLSLEMISYVQFNTGTAQPKLNQEICRKILLKVPCIEEQTKIANFFSAIDDKINLCNTQIEKTEQWKKGLLQKMFV